MIDRVEDFREVDLRILLFDLADFVPDRVVIRDFRRILGALDLEGDDLTAVHLREVALLGVRILDLAQVAELDESAGRKSDLGL